MPREVAADGLGGGGAEQVREDLGRGPPRRSNPICRRARRPWSRGRPAGPRPVLALGGGPVSAAAVMVSAPAIAKRAETPERWSTALTAQPPGEAGQDLDEVVGHVGDQVRLLLDHRDPVVQLGRVVGVDLGAEAVL